VNRKKICKALLAISAFAGLLLVLVLALPLWFPWLLRPLAASHGFRYLDYTRKGYSRFELTNVTFTNQASVLSAKRVAAFVPSVWFWRLCLSRANQPYVTAEEWKWQIQPALNRNSRSPEASVTAAYLQTEQVFRGLNRWLPHAALKDGSLEARGERFRFPQANWDHQKLSGDVIWQKEHGEVVADFRPAHGSVIEISCKSLPLHARVLITRQGEGLLLQSTNGWLTNQVIARAYFPKSGFVPDTAEFHAKSFSIPPPVLGFKGYKNVEGDLSLHWLTNQFKVEITAHASPVNGVRFPPLDVNVSASGNTQSATIQKLKIVAPGLEATLKESATVQYASPYLTEQATLQVALNLEQQHWALAKGRLNGQVEFRPGQGALPESTFTLNGSRIEYSDWGAGRYALAPGTVSPQNPGRNIQTKAVALQGELVWPELRLTQARAETPDGSILSLQGIADLNSRMIYYGQISYQGGALKTWLPEGFTFDQAKISGTVEGAWTNLTHSGQAQFKALKIPFAPLMDFSGTWKGERLRLDPVQLSLRMGKSALDLNGAVDFETKARVLQIATATFHQNGVQKLSSKTPFQIQQSASTTNGMRTSRIDLTPVQLTGSSGTIEADGTLLWPEQGHVNATIQQLELSTFADLLPFVTNHALIRNLEFAGGWSNGPALFQMALSGEAQVSAGRSLALDGRWRGESDGLHVDALSISEHNLPVASLQGVLPVKFRPGNTNGWLEADAKAPLALHADVSPNVFSEIFKTAGLLLKNPEFHTALEGTLENPKGRVQFAASRLQFTRTNQHLPPLDNLRLSGVVDQKTARIESLNFKVAEQPVIFWAEVPLDDSFWSTMPRARYLPDWRKAKAQLKVDHAQVAAFGPYLPKVLSPEGELDGELLLVPGGNLDGALTLSKARTLPIGSLGAVRDILVRLRFNGRKALLEATADLGGNPMPVTGIIDLNGADWLQGQLPPFELKVVAAKAPLSRTPELILKSDLNLAVSYDGKSPVTISGNVNLRDGYYLRDLGGLTSSRVSTPTRRPPYFSIEQEPLANWRLRLNVTGEKFLKVRSPLFNGEVSTALRLQGTLREPMATGELKVNSGEIRFPFATLPITQGLLLLTSENPYRPQVTVAAAARAFGYDIKLDLSGFADQPVVQFSSTPALSSEQILLMVSAGELPRGELAFSNTQKAQRLALFVGKDLLSELGFSGDASRLTIRSGEDISEAGRPTYSVEYKLERNWSVIGEYDRFNDFNLMLKWRFYSH
jgi:translocation and assembly module TamB